jgi:2-amino-4-hydroxy-6-hydroxymethyldihydropteridine diphosphokinase
MTLLALSLGSNLQREKHIHFALDALQRQFTRLEISPVYETRAVGFEGPDFYNLVVVVDTALDLDTLLRKLRQIEMDAGRLRDGKSFQSRNLDIDVLLFGEENLRSQGRNIPRSEIEHAAYVLKPLAQILPKMRHPASGQYFEDLWADFDTDQPAPRRVEFDLQEYDETSA